MFLQGRCRLVSRGLSRGASGVDNIGKHALINGAIFLDVIFHRLPLSAVALSVRSVTSLPYLVDNHPLSSVILD